MPRSETTKKGTWRLKFRYRELDVQERFEVLSITNDVLIALFFVAGSVLFFFKPLETWAITLFLVGSIFFLARPVIRLFRHIHVNRRDRTPPDGSQDF